MNNAAYFHLALNWWWNVHPEDRDIPFIGLAVAAQNAVRDKAKLFRAQDDYKQLRTITQYKPVGGRGNG